MKLCKKLLAVLTAAAMLLVLCIPAALADEGDEGGIEIPDGYDGYVIMDVEALTLGLGCIIPPHVVYYIEGESVADITIRFLEENGLSYEAGSPESFYLTEVEFPGLSELEVNVPDYLMEQLIENYCYDEEDGWDQDEPENDMLAAGCYTYYSGWMYSDNNEDPGVGAGDCIVEEQHVYRWMYSLYGYGMDIGISDGWGMFPPFDNPAEGVDRTFASYVYATVFFDDIYYNACMEGGIAREEYLAFVDAFNYLGTVQEDIDAASMALFVKFLELSFGTPGDVNGNGEVEVVDAIMALRCAMGLIELDDQAYSAADFNGNGEVEVTDAILILRTAMGLI